MGDGVALLARRSVLLGVEPQGAGTPLAEHAASVIVRACWRNRMSLGRVIGEVAAAAVDAETLPAAARAETIARLEHVLRRRGVGLLGTDRVAATWVAWYERLTLRPGLERHTLRPLARVLRSRGVLRAERTYCPAHLAAWRREGRCLYEPLLWQLRPVLVCPDHDRPVVLATRCPNPACGSRRSVLTASALPGVCERCGTGLWTAEPEWAPDGPETEWRCWVTRELGELVAELSILEEYPDGSATIAAMVLAARRAGSLTAFAAAIGVALSTVSLWKDGRRQPALDGILRACRFAGFRVADCLLGRIDVLEAAPVPVTPAWIPPATTTYHDIDWRPFRRALTRAARDPRRPAPATVAARWKVDVRQASRKCPEAWRRAARRYQERLAGEARARAAERERVLLAAIQAIHAENRYPSRHQVQKRVPRRISFRDERIKAAWRRELIRLAWRGSSDTGRDGNGSNGQASARNAS